MISADAQAELDKLVAANALNGTRRLQVIGYASGDPQNVSAQRRLSLARALAVKNYLVERGMPADRIDVRGLGASSEGGPADRAEVLLIGGNGRAAPASQR
jgi:outer membrane protein OmpA-like peptidoglycan-associated protein